MSTAPGTALLDVMRARLGVQELPGSAHNPVILAWFAAVGHAEVEADEVLWCAVTVGAALVDCGLPIPTRDVNMLARSYLSYGVKCAPQPGAIAIWPRGKAWQGHVNVVERVLDDGRVICIGGNQSAKGGDAVTRTAPLDPSTALDFRMPVAPTIPALRQAGSTEIKTGDRIQNLGTATVVGSTVATVAREMVAYVPDVPRFETISDGLTWTQTILEGANAVARVVLANPWLGGLILAGALLAWIGHGFKKARIRKAMAGVPLSAEAARVVA
jgi:uncharacterized protein (TIGR02594 family)